MQRENLEPSEVEQSFNDILHNENSMAESICIGSFLTLLRAKGESPIEIAAMVRAMKGACVPVHFSSMELQAVKGNSV